MIERLYNRYEFRLEGTLLNDKEKRFFQNVCADMEDYAVASSLGTLTEYLSRYYGKRVLVLPLSGTGHYDRDHQSQQSIHILRFEPSESGDGDIGEIRELLRLYGRGSFPGSGGIWTISDQKMRVTDWYDGFTFGRRRDIYNPGQSLISLMIFTKQNAVWTLLLASGYLKVTDTVFAERTRQVYYELELTNKEVRIMFEHMIRDWFSGNDDYNSFIRRFLSDDIKAMNAYMNRVALELFSYFDTGKNLPRKKRNVFITDLCWG